jgi:large subunit ribosomal protein L15
MKLHDLRPAAGAHRPRTRVGRGIAAGKGKTAGRGTKGQKARAGGSIPPWFEGGQTPLHMRIPKLRGFRNPFKIEYEVVNVGRIAALVAAGRLEAAEPSGPTGKGRAKATPGPITVNQEILRATGLVSSLDKPMKVLGGGDVDVPLFVVADAFTRSAREKIEAAGGTVQVLEIPTGPLAALGIEAIVDESGAVEAIVAVEEVIEPDGTVEIVERVEAVDGSAAVIDEVVEPDGTVEIIEEIVEPDGTVEVIDEVVEPDGTVEIIEEIVEPDGTVEVIDEIVEPDGSAVAVEEVIEPADDAADTTPAATDTETDTDTDA